MLSISAKATRSDIRRVWAEIESRQKEILEEEKDFLEGKSEGFLKKFWENEQEALLKRSRRYPFNTVVIIICYNALKWLVYWALALVFFVLIEGLLYGSFELASVFGKVALVFLIAGLALTAISVLFWFRRRLNEGIIKSTIAIQKILASEYNLKSQYSEDINGYAVIMLAAKHLKIGKETEEDLRRSLEDLEKGLFTANTDADFSDDDEEYPE